MKIYDLTLPISSKILLRPGDTKPKITLKGPTKDKQAVTKINMLSHIGTHVDAPLNFFKKGQAIDEIAVEKLVGPCKVVDLTNFFKTGGAAEIGWAHFGSISVRKGDRVLLKTGNFNFLNQKKFTKEYASLSLDAAKNLAKRGISLIGIDYITIEKRINQVQHPIHKMLLEAGIVIVEGLNLKDVPAGEYTLACAPLKIEGADAAPARVFLIKE